MNSACCRGAVTLACVAWLASPAYAQPPEPIQPDLARLAAGHGAQVFNRAVTAAKDGDRLVACLDARSGDGGAWLDGVLLGEGVIEIDLKGKDVAQQSFLGVAFHMADWSTYDAVYFRPFNFKAANPDSRSHGVQYVSLPANAWQKLRAERPGQFEKAVDPAPDPNGWFHARIVLANSKVEVYVNGATTPSLVVDDLGPHKSGGVALWVGNNSDGAFANLSITQTTPPGPPPASAQTVFQASASGNLARLAALIEANPSLVHARNPGALTPLHLAAAYEQPRAAEYLVGKGADLNAVARHSGTPLDLAYESNGRTLVPWLEDKGARVTPMQFDVAALSPATHRIAFLWGMRSNVVVFSGTDGAVVVDTGFFSRPLDLLKQTIAGWSPRGVAFVVNTHDHGDHVAGNAIAPKPEAVITAASLAAPPPGVPITRQAEPLKGRTGRTLPAPYVLRTGGADLLLIRRPGLHSAADLMVYSPRESVVAMGDLLLSESVPGAADVGGYLAFLEDVLDVFPETTTFVAGHGKELTLAGVRAYRDALSVMIGVVRTHVAAGRTAEQMIQDDVLKAYKAQHALLDFLTPDALIPRVVAALKQGTLK